MVFGWAKGEICRFYIKLSSHAQRSPVKKVNVLWRELSKVSHYLKINHLKVVCIFGDGNDNFLVVYTKYPDPCGLNNYSIH